MKTILAMIPLAITGVALTGSGCGSAVAEPAPIRWAVDDGHPQRIALHGDRVNASIDPAAQTQLAALGSQLTGAHERTVAFRLTGEAGTLDCRGTAGLGRGRGTCRFSADDAFVQALAHRGITARPRDMLPLLLVGATLARVDGLAAQGLPPQDNDALMTVSALDIDGRFVAALAQEGLRPRSLDEAVSARALGIDADWLREMSAAGLRTACLADAIELKAVGVDAEYARAITAVLAESRPAKAGAILQ